LVRYSLSLGDRTCLLLHDPFSSNPGLACTHGGLQCNSLGLDPAMSDMFVLGKFWISVQVIERNTFVVSVRWKSAKIRELLRGSHGLTPIGIE
jgi:hypothetical protein